MIHDENEYLPLRQQLLTEPTPSEHVRASIIASQIDFDNPKPPTNPLVQSKLFKRRQ